MSDHRLWRIGDWHVLARSEERAQAVAVELGRPVTCARPIDVTDEPTGEVEAWWPERGRTVRLAPPRQKRRRPDPAETWDRNLRMVEARKAGGTYDAIAADFGLSRARVAQVLKAMWDDAQQPDWDELDYDAPHSVAERWSDGERSHYVACVCGWTSSRCQREGSAKVAFLSHRRRTA